MKTTAIGSLALALTLITPLASRAQTFVKPFVGYDFGGSTGCLNLLICADRHVNAGVSGGRILTRGLGVEAEVAYAKDFFGAATDLSSYVLTLMANAVYTRPIGRWHPFAVGGAGMLKTHIRFTQVDFYATDVTSFAWNLGGGVTFQLSRRWGISADYRYFRSFHDVTLSGFTVSDSKLGFSRAGVGLMVRF